MTAFKTGWSSRMMADGKCRECGALRQRYRRHCDDCQAKRRIYTRRHYRKHRTEILAAHQAPGVAREARLEKMRLYSAARYAAPREEILAALKAHRPFRTGERRKSASRLDADQIRQMRRQHLTWQEIASRLGCSHEAARHKQEPGKKKMASKTRDDRVIALVPCPRCRARTGERCRNPVPHQTRRWCGKHQRWHDCPEDRRPQPIRPHSERRALWTMATRDPEIKN